MGECYKIEEEEKILALYRKFQYFLAWDYDGLIGFNP